ncbi:MAG: 16S rRNA pseudouridine(516) synthase [Zetaproteobacteria bacterium CG2_30_46_52]|nr:MAG: 16S rRNA pseudouridine(516) synthase [Zetaproteobacteria bacterium CG2_30_46_52]
MAQKLERLEKLMSRLGYGSRKDVPYWIKEGWLTVNGEKPTSPSQKVFADEVRLEGEQLDAPDGLSVVYHKPLGVVCSRKEVGRLIYDDLPERWLERKPALSSVGRLDKETSGLLILTDDGNLNHYLTSPKNHISKTYAVTLAEPLQGNEVDLFAAGTLMLEADDKPCLPAELTVTGENTATIVLHEGRYHQVRRMFAAVGNHVASLKRTHTGKLGLEGLGLAAGEYRVIEADDLMALIEGR